MAEMINLVKDIIKDWDSKFQYTFKEVKTSDPRRKMFEVEFSKPTRESPVAEYVVRMAFNVERPPGSRDVVIKCRFEDDCLFKDPKMFNDAKIEEKLKQKLLIAEKYK
eukprot:TRINITY_DN454192_c2_g1_i1.p1 TRINITY_DN454192_c2_g1~~TRINITY_DN454192_c2_g1_i1.p1  ORF type:complete len:108 (-),score=21.87 TRINITY_DN454192_c2_g1_i1:144-467(-)